MKPGDLSRIDSQAAAPAGSCLRPVLRAGAQTPERNETDAIAQEVPVALEYNGISHATLLATPTDLEDFIYGFSYTEGIIRSARDIYGVEIGRDTSELQSLMRISYAVFCLKKKKTK